MSGALDALHGHYVVAGGGRLARKIARDLVLARKQVVLVDPAATPADAPHVVQGDPTEPAVLDRAGLVRAQALFAAQADDDQNARIAQVARALAPSVPVVARAVRDSAQGELQRAGCARVVLGDEASGAQMVNAALRPNVAHVLEQLAQPGRVPLELGPAQVEAGSTLLGCTFAQAIALAQNSIVLALERAGETRYQPAGDERLLEGDVLVVLGAPERIAAFQQLARRGR